MPTYIHHLAVDSKNYTVFRRVVEEYMQENPGIIIRHAVGFLGHNYMVTATKNISKVFQEAGIVCGVNQYSGDPMPDEENRRRNFAALGAVMTQLRNTLQEVEDKLTKMEEKLDVILNLLRDDRQ